MLKTRLCLCIAILFMIVYGCINREERVKKINWYLYRYSANANGTYEQIDTLGNLDCSFDTSNLFLSRVDTLNYRGIKHLLRTYALIPKVVCSGGTLYCLDDFGVIYNRSEPWGPYYYRKFSDNDSINDLLSQTMAHILSLETLRNQHVVQKLVTGVADFVPPKIKKFRKKRSVQDSTSD